jgi:hypothetical protein
MFPRRPRRARRHALWAAALALGVAACSDDGSISTPTTTPGADTDTPTPLPNPNYTGECRTLADVVGLPSRHWCVVPDSDARGVEKRASEWGDWNGASSASYQSYQGNVGFNAIISAWSGAAYDSQREWLIVAGGGHADYGGNELLAFDLPNLRWRRLTDPTPNPARIDDGAYRNGDNTPVSRHTYGGLAYLTGTDRLWMFSGAGWYNGWSVPGAWTFNLAAIDPATPVANATAWQDLRSANEPAPGVEEMSVHDPVSGRVFWQRQAGGLYSHDPATNTWQLHINDGGTSLQSFMALHPGLRRIYQFNVNGSGSARYAALPADLAQPLSFTAIALAGDSIIAAADSAGIEYDSTAGALVAYAGGTSVYTFNTDTNGWSRIDAAAGNLANPGARSAAGGVFGRFRYSARYNVYVYVDAASNNVYLYRLAPTPSDFSVRCADPNVVRCWGFDTEADIGTPGFYPAGDETLCTNGVCKGIDTSVYASGGGALRMEIPSGSGQNSSGGWRGNFRDDNSVQFGEGEEFYMQWRQRLSADHLATLYSGGGWKQIIIGEGDRNGFSADSCTSLEVVLTNNYHRNVVQGYWECGRYQSFEVPWPQAGPYEFNFQNLYDAGADANPRYCLYSNRNASRPMPGCFAYVADEWMTFQVRIKVGTWGQPDSEVDVWVSRAGRPATLIISRRDLDLFPASVNSKYGKVWLLPYNTGKIAGVAHPVGYTWYDELIVSRARIPDPAM